MEWNETLNAFFIYNVTHPHADGENATTRRGGGGGNVPPWYEAGRIQIPLYTVIFMLAVIGNTLVILTLVQNQRMRTITNLFLLNLAVSDLLLGVLCMPFTLIGALLRDFVFGEVMCKLLPFLQESLDKELCNIRKDLQKNGYSKKLVDRTLDQTLARTNQGNTKEILEQQILTIPYVRGLSERIKRKGGKYNVRVCLRSGNTIRSQPTKIRPPNKNSDTNNCVHRIPCECGKSYIGETKRPLELRISEHKKNTQRGETTKSGIAEHVWTNHHNIKWSEAEVIHKEEHWFKRKFKEAAYILNNDAFSHASVEIRNVWNVCGPRHGPDAAR